MNFGFQKPYPTKFEAWTNTPDELADGRNWRFLEPLYFTSKDGREFRAVAGSKTDGVSTPAEVWCDIAPFTYWLCGAFHDALYHDSTEIWDDDAQSWVKWTCPDHKIADELIGEALESRGCDFFKRTAIVDALMAFGEIAFNNDRTKPIVPTPTPA